MVHQKFLDLYDSCFDDVYRYVYFKVGSKWDADDIVSDIFKKAYEKFRTVKGDPKYWLFSIARNTVIDYYRKKKDMAVAYEDMEAAMYPGMISVSPEEDLELIGVKEALGKLSKEELEIINLRCFSDMTYESIGKHLNKSDASVKVKFSRIIKKLREMLNPSQEGLE